MYRGLKTLLKQTISTGMITAVFLLITSISNTLYAGYATIFIYHKFGEDRYPTTSVSIKDFTKQMEYLKKNGYNVIHLSKLVDYIQRGEEIPEKTVVITIDDGYKSTMKAYRILKGTTFPLQFFCMQKV
ncbi:MAG: hypothetical protein Q9M89_07475 [Persephonella sp.]|nr:hypothetical protein [Persephonella sp.]